MFQCLGGVCFVAFAASSQRITRYALKSLSANKLHQMPDQCCGVKWNGGESTKSPKYSTKAPLPQTGMLAQYLHNCTFLHAGRMDRMSCVVKQRHKLVIRAVAQRNSGKCRTCLSALEVVEAGWGKTGSPQKYNHLTSSLDNCWRSHTDDGSMSPFFSLSTTGWNIWENMSEYGRSSNGRNRVGFWGLLVDVVPIAFLPERPG